MKNFTKNLAGIFMAMCLIFALEIVVNIKLSERVTFIESYEEIEGKITNKPFKYGLNLSTEGLGENSSLKLSIPKATIDKRTVMIEKVDNASSYNIAICSGEVIIKEYNTNLLKFNIPFTPQGRFNVKVQAVSNNKLYENSLYSTEIGLLIIEEIPKITIKEFLLLENEKYPGGHFTKYELTGEIVEIKSASSGNLSISDGTGKVSMVYIDPPTDSNMNIEDYKLMLGDIISVIGKKKEVVGTIHLDQGVLVNVEHNYIKNFEYKNTLCSMNVEYIEQMDENNNKTFMISKDINLKNKIGIRFGCILEKDLIDNLMKLGKNVKFGVVYAKESTLNGKKFLDSLTENMDNLEIVECNPELIDNMYQFAVVIDHIPDISFNDEVNGSCYACIDGIYYLMNCKKFSINTICDYYINNMSDDIVVQEHLEMLEWLKNINK